MTSGSDDSWNLKNQVQKTAFKQAIANIKVFKILNLKNTKDQQSIDSESRLPWIDGSAMCQLCASGPAAEPLCAFSSGK